MQYINKAREWLAPQRKAMATIGPTKNRADKRKRIDEDGEPCPTINNLRTECPGAKDARIAVAPRTRVIDYPFESYPPYDYNRNKAIEDNNSGYV
jgi:hypothetical protein